MNRDSWRNITLVFKICRTNRKRKIRYASKNFEVDVGIKLPNPWR
jgi:hypothetical protein